MDLIAYVRQNIQTVPAALKALAAMDKQISNAKTYREIKQVEDAATTLKFLFKSVDEVKKECELVIIEARARIGDELDRIPKASGGDRKSKGPRGEPLKGGRGATGIPKVSQHRLKKLNKLPKAERRAIAKRRASRT